MTLRVGLDELLPIKTAARGLPAQIDRLTSGDVDQLVVTRRGEPRAVLITVERFEALLALQTVIDPEMVCTCTPETSEGCSSCKPTDALAEEPSS